MLERAKRENLNVVFSGVVNDDDEPTPGTLYLSQGKRISPTPELMFDYEEADWRIVPHLNWNM